MSHAALAHCHARACHASDTEKAAKASRRKLHWTLCPRYIGAALGHWQSAGMLCRAPVQLQGLTRCQAPISVTVRHSEQRSEQILDHSQLHLVAACCERELGSLLRLIAGRRSWGHQQSQWAGKCTATSAPGFLHVTLPAPCWALHSSEPDLTGASPAPVYMCPVLQLVSSSSKTLLSRQCEVQPDGGPQSGMIRWTPSWADTAYSQLQSDSSHTAVQVRCTTMPCRPPAGPMRRSSASCPQTTACTGS